MPGEPGDRDWVDMASVEQRLAEMREALRRVDDEGGCVFLSIRFADGSVEQWNPIIPNRGEMAAAALPLVEVMAWFSLSSYAMAESAQRFMATCEQSVADGSGEVQDLRGEGLGGPS